MVLTTVLTKSILFGGTINLTSIFFKEEEKDTWVLTLVAGVMMETGGISS